MTEELLTQQEGGVLTLTMNREQRLNALTPAMMAAMLHTMRQAASDPQVRVLVLTGAGRAFCAGGDVKAMAERDSTPTLEDKVAWLRERMECSRLLHEMRKPTMAVARGAVAGAGLSLALACDLFIVSEQVKITSAFVKVGLSGDYGGSWFLQKRLGARARAFAFLSPVIDGKQAVDLGLADRVVSDAELQSAGTAIARQLAAQPPIALGYLKSNLNYAEEGAALAAALDHEAIRHARCGLTEDHHEAARAFVEKRAGHYVGR